MLLLDALSGPVWECVRLALLHFLWQGLLVASVLAGVLWLFRVRRAQARYALCLVAMAATAVCPVATFLVLGTSSEIAAVDRLPATDVVSGRDSAEPPHRATWNLELADRTRAAHPYLLLGWLAGAFLLGGRLLLAQVGVHRLRRRAQPISAELASGAAMLARRLGLRPAPGVFAVENIREAVVVGILRPMVLLPASWLVEMTPEALEAVIAHELAHVRRWDLWVNLFQRLVETLLFYHPAVWWLSRRIRLEREMCCDEMAVAATGKRIVYASVLQLVGRKRLAATQPAFAAAMGGSRMALLCRVRNVLGLAPLRERGRWQPLGLAAMIAPAAIGLATAGIAQSQPGKTPADEEARPTVVKPGDHCHVDSADAERKPPIVDPRFVGNAVVTDRRLREIVGPDLDGTWDSKPKLDLGPVDECVERLTDHYRGLGFFRARIRRGLQLKQGPDRLVVVFVIDEGPRYGIRKISFAGNFRFSDEKLADKLKLNAGSRFQQAQMDDDVAAIRDEYGRLGYIFADVKVDVRFVEEPRELDLVYLIAEGKRYRVGRIDVEIPGTASLETLSSVLQCLCLKSGDIVDLAELRESERRLRALDWSGEQPSVVMRPAITLGPSSRDSTVVDLCVQTPQRRQPLQDANERGFWRSSAAED